MPVRFDGSMNSKWVREMHLLSLPLTETCVSNDMADTRNKRISKWVIQLIIAIMSIGNIKFR